MSSQKDLIAPADPVNLENYKNIKDRITINPIIKISLG
jgi:hypothetical protein